MNMNKNNGSVRTVVHGQAGPAVHCPGEPIVAGRAAEAACPGMGTPCNAAAQAAPCGCGCNPACGADACTSPCSRCVDFCETLTLHESFNPSGVTVDCARIAYDTSFLGYTVEELTMDAALPCGGCCPVPVQRISLTGAIPYIISVGPVTSGCGCPVDLSIQGSTMVDEVVGYACGGCDPNLNAITCSNVTPCIQVSVEPCGCSDKTNITVCGRFTFNQLPALM